MRDNKSIMAATESLKSRRSHTNVDLGGHLHPSRRAAAIKHVVNGSSDPLIAFVLSGACCLLNSLILSLKLIAPLVLLRKPDRQLTCIYSLNSSFPLRISLSPQRANYRSSSQW